MGRHFLVSSGDPALAEGGFGQRREASGTDAGERMVDKRGPGDLFERGVAHELALDPRAEEVHGNRSNFVVGRRAFRHWTDHRCDIHDQDDGEGHGPRPRAKAAGPDSRGEKERSRHEETRDTPRIREERPNREEGGESGPPGPVRRCGSTPERQGEQERDQQRIAEELRSFEQAPKPPHLTKERQELEFTKHRSPPRTETSEEHHQDRSSADQGHARDEGALDRNRQLRPGQGGEAAKGQEDRGHVDLFGQMRETGSGIRGGGRRQSGHQQIGQQGPVRAVAP